MGVLLGLGQLQCLSSNSWYGCSVGNPPGLQFGVLPSMETYGSRRSALENAKRHPKVCHLCKNARNVDAAYAV